MQQVRAWRESPSLTLLAEDEEYWPVLESLLERSRVTGPAVHDARIAALCLRHGVRELLTADRDFSRFPELKIRNPLI
jgi:predicted nucleic acid-binding protein